MLLAVEIKPERSAAATWATNEANTSVSAWSTLTRMARNECVQGLDESQLCDETSRLSLRLLINRLAWPLEGQWQMAYSYRNHLQGCLFAPSPRLQLCCSLRRSHHHRGTRRRGQNLARSMRSGQGRPASYTLAKPHPSRAGPTPTPPLLLLLLLHLGRLRPLPDPPVPPYS